MEVQFIYQNGRYRVHPDSEKDFLSAPPWDRHATYHSLCQRAYADNNPNSAPTPPTSLSLTGIEVIRGAIDSQQATKLSARMGKLIAADREDRNAGVADMGGDDNTVARVKCDLALKERVVGLLPNILNDETCAALKSHFGAQFRIDNISLYRAYPAAAPLDSFLWHRDVAPVAQVHIMVYLTEGTPETGQTSFLDFEQTREAARLGYHFPEITSRTGVEEEIFEGSDVTPLPDTPELAPGDGVIFSSVRILHRGIAPESGFRDVMILVLNPSFVPWTHDIQEFGTDFMFHDISWCTLRTNPFQDCNPQIMGELDCGLRIEEWIRMGDFFPSA